MFGVASQSLRNSKINQFMNSNFIGYRGGSNGDVFVQGKYSLVNTGGIRTGDIIKVFVNVK
jgi:hypothetical protein